VNFWKINAAENISRPTATGGTENLTATRWRWSVSSPNGDVNSSANGVFYFDTQGEIVYPVIGADPNSIPDGSDIKPQFTLTPDPQAGGAPFTVTLDLLKTSMFASDFTAKPYNVDGYATGNLVTFNTGADGIITGVYDNGEQQP
jgi:flagellar hook protein FlgE